MLCVNFCIITGWTLSRSYMDCDISIKQTDWNSETLCACAYGISQLGIGIEMRILSNQQRDLATVRILRTFVELFWIFFFFFSRIFLLTKTEIHICRCLFIDCEQLKFIWKFILRLRIILVF